MSGVLVINAAEKAAIARAIELARDAAVPLDVARRAWIDDSDMPTDRLSLADREKLADFMIPPRSQHVMLGTYRAAISFEHQPAGLCRHLSISSARPGMIPGDDVLRMVFEAFGFTGERPGRAWLEEFAPGHHAVNVIEVEP